MDKSLEIMRNHHYRWSIPFFLFILTLLPYISASNLPSGDPAPGRSPGPPTITTTEDSNKTQPYEESNIAQNQMVETEDPVVSTLSNVEVTESFSAVENACAFAMIDSDVVTVDEGDSRVNLTVSHPVFDAGELVRGVVYDVTLETKDNIRDYVILSTIDNVIRGNFTPTSSQDQPCPNQEPPHFIQKHLGPKRKRYYKISSPKLKRDITSNLKKQSNNTLISLKKSDTNYKSDYRTFNNNYYRTRYLDSINNSSRLVRSLDRVYKSVRYRGSVGKVVSGEFLGRNKVVLKWSVSDNLHVESGDARVVFRIRYRMDDIIYQTFFTKFLRLDCALRLRHLKSGRIHSGHLPKTRSCHLIIPPPSPEDAILFELHKLNVPCTNGFIKFTQTSSSLCGKLEQIPNQNRRYIYHHSLKPYLLEFHGRPTFVISVKLVDYCHYLSLYNRNGSYEIGPTEYIHCSIKIHLPYGNKVALRLQMGAGPITTQNLPKDNEINNYDDCNGMGLVLEDGELIWRHCSKKDDPLKSVQIISESNVIKLNISVFSRNSVRMWLKIWWMEKVVDDIVGGCDYGWVASGDFCVSSFRDLKRIWQDAEEQCLVMGGHLASVLNERQQFILDRMLTNAPGSGVDDVYWVGATDAVHEGEFRWSNGMPFSYAHWFPDWRKHTSQPNDDGVSGQDCVEVRQHFPPRPAASTFLWNDRGCDEHNYYVCEKPRNPEATTSSTIQCNDTIHLSPGDPHASISSPGFPMPYPDDAVCSTIVMAPAGTGLLLHFEEFVTEYEPHCSYDFLVIEELGLMNGTEHQDALHHQDFHLDNEVWEDPEFPLLASDTISAGWLRNSSDLPSRRLCGDWSGKLKLLRYESASSVVRLQFRSDHARHLGGFRVKVSLANAHTCADAKQVSYKGYCYLFTGHPRTTWATAKQICEDLNMHLASIHSLDEDDFITAGLRQSSDYSALTVYWLGGRLETSRDQSSLRWIDSSAVVYQGWPPYNDSLSRIDGDYCLGLQWISSKVPSQPSGLYWVSQQCSKTGGYVCKRRLPNEHIVSNRTVDGMAGNLSSPNYPAPYDSNLDYWVHVQSPADTRLVFIFHQLHLEHQADCLYDYIEILDPKHNKTSRYCGSHKQLKWFARGNVAVLHFHSDYETQGMGFFLSYRGVDMSGCPAQTFTAKEGVIRSPNYPDFLLPDLDCVYDIVAPKGKRIFLNITVFDFGYGEFTNGVPPNNTEMTLSEDCYIEIQTSQLSEPVKAFQDLSLLTNGIYLSDKELLKIRIKTGPNVTGKGFLAYYKSVTFLNTTQVVDLRSINTGELHSLNYPGPPATNLRLRTVVVAPHYHTLSLAMSNMRLAAADQVWPCGEGVGWVEVVDNYTDNNGTYWTLCEVNRMKRNPTPTIPLVINSYLNVLIITQIATENAVGLNAGIIVNKDPEYLNKIMMLPEDTNLETCQPNPCQNNGVCFNDLSRNVCQCASYYTGVFCLLTACDRSPCAFGNCTLSHSRLGSEGFECTCTNGWKGRRCNEKIKPCASKPCNNRGACIERDGSFLCQCNPSWKGKRCEIINPNPNIIGLGTRMIHEPFWLGLLAVFVVLGLVGLVWCAQRHFPEKIEKLLAEEADRCSRPAAAGRRSGAMSNGGTAEPAGRALLSRLGIRKPSVSGFAGGPRAARTFSLDDLLKPATRRKEWSATRSRTLSADFGTPSPRKKRNNSTPTKKNAAEKKQILQQLISPHDPNKKFSMSEFIQMTEKRKLNMTESAPSFIEYGMDKETSFNSEASSPSTSPSLRHIPDPKMEKKVTFARLMNKVSAEMSSSSEVDMSNTITIPMAVISRGFKGKASSTPPSPGVDTRSPHSTSSNQGSDSLSSLDLTLANVALKKYNRQSKISSADSILAMFRNFSSSTAAMASRASSGGISASSTPSASSPQDDTVDNDDVSLASSLVPSLAPDSPIYRPNNTIEIQVVDHLTAKTSTSGGNLLHPPSILLEVPSGINKCLSPIRELPTPLPTPIPTPLPTPLPSPRMPRVKMDADTRSESTVTEDEMDIKSERPSSGLRLRLRQSVGSCDTPSPSTLITDSPSPSFTQSQDSDREMSTPSPLPILNIPILTIERATPGSPPPKRSPPIIEFQPPPLITITYNASEESDEPISPRPPSSSSNMCYLSPFSISARGERAPSESNLSSSGYSSMASPGPSRCGSSNPLCPSEMEDPGSGGGGTFQRRRPLMKTNSGPGTSTEECKEGRRGRSDSETLSDDPLLESNDEGIGTDERIDDVPTSAKQMETFVKDVIPSIEIPQIELCSPSGVTKCSITCPSSERLEERVTLKLPNLHTDGSKPLSPVSSRSESPLSDRTGFGRISPQFYGRQLPFTDSDCVYDFQSSDCSRNNSGRGSNTPRKGGKKRERRSARTISHEAAGTSKTSLPHMPHSMHNLLEVPSPRDTTACNLRGRRLGRRRSRSQALALATSSSSEDSVSAASVASVASAKELRVTPDLDLQDTTSKISSSLDLTEDSRKPIKVNKLRTISNQIRFLRRLERSLKMREALPISDEEGDESSSVTSPLLQTQKDVTRLPMHANSAPILTSTRPKISRQRRYDKSLLGEDSRTLNVPPGRESSD